MKKSYMVPDLEMFMVRPDEQIAVACTWENFGDDTHHDPSISGGVGGYGCYTGWSEDKVYGITGS